MKIISTNKQVHLAYGRLNEDLKTKISYVNPKNDV